MSQMVISGATLIAADGLHDDGWCWPRTRLSLQALQPSTVVRIGLWLKPEAEGPTRVLFTLSPDGFSPKAEFIELGRPLELSAPVDLAAGAPLGLRLSTPHRASRGEDVRDLSFVLTSISLI